MNKRFRALRKYWELPQFERKCRKTKMGGRLIKAYKVPGTQEHGEREMRMRYVWHAMMMSEKLWRKDLILNDKEKNKS